MRLINYINEERQLKFSQFKEFEKNDLNTQKIKKFEKNTKPWWDYCNKQGVKNKFLWRGTNYIVKSFVKRKTRKNREPSDTCFEFHNLSDIYFYDIFGIRARSQTVFCFSDKDQTYNYGSHPYIIIPSGKFNYIWSPIIKDFFSYAENENFYSEICDKYYNPDYNISGKTKKKLYNLIKSFYIKNERFKDLMDNVNYNKNEIMLSCKEYYIINEDWAFKYLSSI